LRGGSREGARAVSWLARCGARGGSSGGDLQAFARYPADREPPPAPRPRLGASARQRRTRPPRRQIRPRGVRGGRARPRPARPRGVDRPPRPVRRRTRRPAPARGSLAGGTRNRATGAVATPTAYTHLGRTPPEQSGTLFT